MSNTSAHELPDEPAPYRGLLPFQPEHARFFFGREAECRQLVQKLGRHTFVAIVGASGSGKSSLVRAGLLPALACHALPGSSAWQVLTFTPGSRPLRALAIQLATLDPDGERLETVDRLTELLTQRADGLHNVLSTSWPNVIRSCCW